MGKAGSENLSRTGSFTTTPKASAGSAGGSSHNRSRTSFMGSLPSHRHRNSLNRNKYKSSGDLGTLLEAAGGMYMYISIIYMYTYSSASCVS